MRRGSWKDDKDLRKVRNHGLGLLLDVRGRDGNWGQGFEFTGDGGRGRVSFLPVGLISLSVSPGKLGV